ncbi:MAG: hypothetical protein HY791_00870 [Deltaproteobacteria bacterium]|nr:hypothetical protein [Deltaproteobacteria bacterium]
MKRAAVFCSLGLAGCGIPDKVVILVGDSSKAAFVVDDSGAEPLTVGTVPVPGLDDGRVRYLLELDEQTLAFTSPYYESTRVSEVMLEWGAPKSCSTGELAPDGRTLSARLPEGTRVARVMDGVVEQLSLRELPFGDRLHLRIPASIDRCAGDPQIEIERFTPASLSSVASTFFIPNRIGFVDDDTIYAMTSFSFAVAHRGAEHAATVQLSDWYPQGAIVERTGDAAATILVAASRGATSPETAVLELALFGDSLVHVRTTTVGLGKAADIALGQSDLFVLGEHALFRQRDGSTEFAVVRDFAPKMSHFRGSRDEQLLVSDSTVYSGQLDVDRWTDWSRESGFPQLARIQDALVTDGRAWIAGNTLVERPREEEKWEARAPVYVPNYDGPTISDCGFTEIDSTVERIAPFPEESPTHLVILLDDEPQAVMYRLRDGCAVAVTSPDEHGEFSSVAVMGTTLVFGGHSGLMRLRTDP